METRPKNASLEALRLFVVEYMEETGCTEHEALEAFPRVLAEAEAKWAERNKQLFTEEAKAHGESIAKMPLREYPSDKVMEGFSYTHGNYELLIGGSKEPGFDWYLQLYFHGNESRLMGSVLGRSMVGLDLTKPTEVELRLSLGQHLEDFRDRLVAFFPVVSLSVQRYRHSERSVS